MSSGDSEFYALVKGTPALLPQHCGYRSSQEGKVKITQIPGVSNPADLGTKHLDDGSIRRALERCHCYVREVRSGVALRADVQEITRPHPKVITFDDAGELETQSETEMESDSNDTGSSDSGETETAAGRNDVNPT